MEKHDVRQNINLTDDLRPGKQIESVISEFRKELLTQTEQSVSVMFAALNDIMKRYFTSQAHNLAWQENMMEKTVPDVRKDLMVVIRDAVDKCLAVFESLEPSSTSQVTLFMILSFTFNSSS